MSIPPRSSRGPGMPSVRAHIRDRPRRIPMSTDVIFPLQLVCGYVAWLLAFGAYGWPRLTAMDAVAAQRAIATLHSFRFFGQAFLVPGVVGPQLPASFASFAA